MPVPTPATRGSKRKKMRGYAASRLLRVSSIPNCSFEPGALCVRVRMVVPERQDGPVIPQFYAGRELFITGATGFMGKMVVERLLATCPEVGRLHLLVRTKKDDPPETRLTHLKQSPVFDVLRRINPHQLDKLRLVPGDITKHNLGLTDQDVTALEQVSVVFNSAATVKFDEELALALEQNVSSVSRLLDVCDRLPNVMALVHVSTAYCYTERALVEERVYPPLRPLPQMLHDAAAPMTTSEAKRFISPKPNTYTFTKMLAENVVAQHTHAHYARAIFRPTIVISSLRDPFPGWIENLNGPSGVGAAVASGALRVLRCDGAARADLLPVDIAVDTLITAAWETAIDQLSAVRVYNCSSMENPTDWELVRRCMVQSSRSTPSARAIWYPNFIFAKSMFNYKTLKFLLQSLPLHLADFFSRIFSSDKNRLDLSRLSSRLSAMNNVMEYFTTRSFHFSTHNTRRLRARLAPRDAAIYNLDPNTIEWKAALTQLMAGVRRHLLRERDDFIPAARRRMRRLYFLDRGLSLLAAALVARWAARGVVAMAAILRRFLYGSSLLGHNASLLSSTINDICTSSVY